MITSKRMAVLCSVAVIISVVGVAVVVPMDALAQQTTPTPDPDATPEPPSESEPTPEPEPEPEPTPEPEPAPEPSPEPLPKPALDEDASSKTDKGQKRDTSTKGANREAELTFLAPDTPSTGLSGSFDTRKLVGTSERLRKLGASFWLWKRAFSPFIIAGRAQWTNSWGAPRRDGGSRIVRAHEGQDVFCDRGTRVLAAAKGRIEFDGGGLGGKVARIHMGNGEYLYYAHLERFNTKRFDSGDLVRRGDVIGFCGSTGNAAATAPHVHFGWYKGGVAYDPMVLLAHRLERAESKSRRLIRLANASPIARPGKSLLARRFGDHRTPAGTSAPFNRDTAQRVPVSATTILGTADRTGNLPPAV